jgi:hypothetical protein
MTDLTLSRLRPVWLASYPRSGNTFLRIILQTLFQLPTYSVYRVEGKDSVDPSADALDDAPFLPADWRTRFSADPDAQLVPIKTHGPPEASGPVIFIARDGRAAIDSYFHYHRKFAFEQPSLTEVIAGACQFGSWSSHYRAWQPQKRPNTLFLKYEELVSRPTDLVPRIAEFIGVRPREGRLPSFVELNQRLPAFFRRGQNEEFLREWTPSQLALFYHLHGAVMEALDYPRVPGGRVEEEEVLKDLAASAERLHRLYLEQLNHHGESWKARQQLTSELRQLTSDVQRLSVQAGEKGRELERLSAEIARREQVLQPLLHNRWVRLGMALRFVECGNNESGTGAARP